MNKKKMTGKHIKLIINFLCLIIFVVSYLLIYNDLLNKTEAAKKETSEYKLMMEDREVKLSEEEKTLMLLEEKKDQVQDIIDTFPVYIAKEDNYMFAEELNAALGIGIPSISITDNVLLYETALPSRKASEASNAANMGIPVYDKMTAFVSTIGFSFSTTYSGFKDIVDYLQNYPERIAIDSASISYDSTSGSLNGSMILKRYALTGTGKVYEPPYINNINIGTDNIFGTKTPKEQDVEPEVE